MKNRIRLSVVLLLCAALLCGCAAPGQAAGMFAEPLMSALGSPAEEQIPRFPQMKYERPQEALDDLCWNVDRLEKALSSGAAFEDITAILDLCYEDYYRFDTMFTIAEIRSCQDMTDAYYAEEFSWCDDAYYDLKQQIDDMYYLCAASDLAERLEEEYFWEGFAQEYADAELSSYNERSLALMHRESALLSEYRALTANPTVWIDGEEIDVNSALASADGEEYERILMASYRSSNEELSRIYIELVKTREELAEVLGFDSYEQMAYLYDYERDYSPEQAAAYLEDIRSYLVPLYEEIAEDDFYSSVDYPYLSDFRLYSILFSGAENMGGTVQEAFDFMSEYELYDIRFDPNKSNKSFQTYLSDYDAPFVFLDPYSDDSDILSFAHEFGHFLDAYVNYNAYESIDLAECFSQAMEYLMLSYLEGRLSGRRLENLRRMKSLDTLDTYVQQASFAAFEEEVYRADPETLSAEWLNELSLRLAKDYGYYDGVSEEYYALSWTDITHFFIMPFYVVSYTVSNDMAMQIWELERAQPGAGLEKYLEVLPREHDGLIDTLEEGGLESPFAPGRIEKVAADLRELLSGNEAAAAA